MIGMPVNRPVRRAPLPDPSRKQVALLQISTSWGGAETRMGKVAIQLAQDPRIQVALVVNRRLAQQYRSKAAMHEQMTRAGVEIRTLEGDEWSLSERLSRYLAALAARILWKIGFRATSLQLRRKQFGSLLRRFDVVHAFYGRISFDALLHVVPRPEQTLLQEVTSHRIAPVYGQMIKALTPNAGARVRLLCVSRTVEDVLRRQAGLVALTANPQLEIETLPGPFVGLVAPALVVPKERVIVFAHRLEPAKNGPLLARVVRTLLDQGSLDGWRVRFLAYGPEQPLIESILTDHIADGRVDLGWSSFLEADLAKSAIFVSLIETGNYPSQSIFEALGHGNMLCVSDTGLTKEKFPPRDDVTFYTSLDEADVAEALLRAVATYERLGSDQTGVAARDYFREIQNRSGYLDYILREYGLASG